MRKYRNAASDYEYGAMLGENLSFAASEAYKLLRTNLDFALSDEQKCRIIGMTSSVRGEGKSTTTLNLAYSIAEAGKLVLLKFPFHVLLLLVELLLYLNIQVLLPQFAYIHLLQLLLFLLGSLLKHLFFHLHGHSSLLILCFQTL